MEEILLPIYYESLTSATLAFIGVFIPFAGAYWIYKRTIKSNAELKIFEVGREICEVLHEATDIRSPLGGIAYSYIDKNIPLVNEPNRNLAIHKLLKKLLHPFPQPDNNLDLDETG